MENNKKMRELYKIYLELGHEVFEEKIKKPMKLYLHNNHYSSNVITMNSLDTVIANAMENSKLGEAGFYEYDLFSPQRFEEEICFDDIMPPNNDDYNDGYDSFTPTITNEKDFAYVESDNNFMLVDHDKNVLCDVYIVESIHDATELFMLLSFLSLC